MMKSHGSCNGYSKGYVLSGETYGPINSPIFIKNGKKYINVMSGQTSRYLLIPSTDEIKVINCIPMGGATWNRMVEMTKIPTMEQRKKMADDYIKNMNIKQEEVNNRKAEYVKEMEKTEKIRKLNPIEVENELRRNYTLERANDLLLDQDDSVKEFNRMVALKKCLATWDLQILEKEKIMAEQRSEQTRAERDAEQERRQRVKEDEITRQKEKLERQNFIKTLGEQIEEREISMKLQMEKKQLERAKFNRAARQAEIDEMEFFQEKKRQDAKVREEQRRVNVLLQKLKAIDIEEDRLFAEKAEKKAMEMRKEVEGIEEIKREIERKRKEELKKMSDDKLKKEEEAKFKDLMEEVLRMDNIERSWRQKELMEMADKQKKLDEMYSQLEKQVVSRRVGKAQEIDGQRREVCKIAKENIEDEEKDRAAARKIKEANETQRMEILLQINAIDQRKLMDKRDREIETNFYKIQEESKVERAKNAMWKRTAQIRRDGLPEKYMNDIETYISDKFGPPS